MFMNGGRERTFDTRAELRKLRALKQSVARSLWAFMALLTPFALATRTSAAEDQYSLHIRQTDPLTPEEEKRSFQLPAGFEAQIVAAEPEIQKPINLAFDAQGRLWVSGSTEYPVAAPLDEPGRDSIRILEDTDGNGTFEKVTVFADGLNIPIGLFPFKNGCIAFSIPNIYYFEDLDGDDRVDRRTVLYGPLDHMRDTHGLNNAFRRGFDGWLYACHGWANESTVEAADGSRIEMTGGNTYRMKVDGSRVEHITHGQVNPFGMTFDTNGDLFNSDCHTKPIMLLLRGGYYDSFGKPHDGLGYVPEVMSHSHGSTAIAGVCKYSGDRFPKEFHGNMFVGNVVTSRVNRDSLRYRGSTVQAVEEADFVVSEDPWFRPVDLQVGPDGALYIADFYNKVIGHVEVPHDHPARDSERGRIWRIVYVGDDENSAQEADAGVNLRLADLSGLIDALGHSNLELRLRSTDEIVDRIGTAAVPALRKSFAAAEDAKVRVHCIWALQRLGGLNADDLVSACHDSDALVRRHAMKVLAETKPWDSSHRQRTEEGLNDDDALVRRMAIDAFAQHPDPGNVKILMDVWDRTDEADVHAAHVIKIALKATLNTSGSLDDWLEDPTETESWWRLAKVALAVPTAESARFVLAYLEGVDSPPQNVTQMLSHVARHLPADVSALRVARLAQRFAGSNLNVQLELIQAVRRGIRLKGNSAPPEIIAWGHDLAAGLLASIDVDSLSWFTESEAGQAHKVWSLEPRTSSDGQTTAFLSSLPLGETYVGNLRSHEFAVPDQLEFYICGHLGFPEKPAIEENRVSLVLSDTGEAIAEALAPQNDIAQRVTWDLKQYRGRRAYLLVADGVDVAAFAWLAVGRFNPSVVTVPSLSPAAAAQRCRAAAVLIRDFQLTALNDALQPIVLSTHLEAGARAAAADALLATDSDTRLRALLPALTDTSTSAALRDEVALAIVDRNGPQTQSVFQRVFRELPARVQRGVATSLASSRDGARLLISLSESGAASPRLLQETEIRQRLDSLLAHDLDLAASVAELLRGLPNPRVELLKIMHKRQQVVPRADRSATRGEQVFKKHCAACHAYRGQGAVVGPQLDGVSNRGAERLLEDIHDPNRNVDPKFRVTLFELDDGRIVTGLFRRAEGDLTAIVNAEGKEVTFATSSIETKQVSQNSVMPDNFATALTDQEAFDLVEFLSLDRSGLSSSVKWRMLPVDQKFRSEGVAIGDVDRDGDQDVMVGEYWYENPQWQLHEITKPGNYGNGATTYSSAFLCYADDVNQDDWIDLIVIGFPGAPCHWYENPRGEPGHWDKHLIWPSACNETPHYVDLFGNGKRVLLMGWQPKGKENEGQMAWFTPASDPTQPWTPHPISPAPAAGVSIPGSHRFSHGLGVADLNGDKLLDVICTEGWWQQPPKVSDQPWTFHPAPLGEACSNMHGEDLDGDGRTDVLSSSAHNYGIWMHLQRGGGPDHDPTFVTTNLFPQLLSQTHALHFKDIDGDGLRDIVTGKRWWAHGPSGDPGSDEPAVLYWFQAKRSPQGLIQYTPHLIHSESGVGLQFVVQDFNGDGQVDVVTSNKRGVFVFEQIRQ